MNLNPTNPQLPNADPNTDLDRALATTSDSILPSSGFADSVMTAVYRETSAPAPLAFPWKRAIPGFGAAAIAATLLIAAVVSFFHSPSSRNAPALPLNLQNIATHLAQQTNGTTWLIVSLAISGACLLFCRRLVSSR
jgi:hypothetical protein